MSQTPPPRENLLVNLLCSLVLPTLILTKFSSPTTLGPLWGLVVALAFPIGYGLYDFSRRRKTNFIAIIGFCSVLLSGGLGLYKAGGFWFAVKDAAMPTLIGLAVLATARSKRPLVREVLFNEQFFDVPKIESALEARGTKAAFETLIFRCSLALAANFLVSAVLNFFVARWLLTSEPGTEAFNAELGKMHTLGTVITLVPALAAMMFILWRLFGGLERLTGLTQDEMMRDDKKPTA
ncbi:VC0807 family protein [Nibricoccus sp. IMCC34717]|uniref:VC0807 family protein n=1 Tax=Nibricoccus sp. IMCC34717 TaxID=3034021 RepID=UPI00384FADAD